MTDPEKNAISALWVIEACYDNEKNEAIISQGSAFQLKDVGIVTCAHVVSENGKIFDSLEAFKYSDPTVRYRLNVDRICSHRDVAICSIIIEEGVTLPDSCIGKSASFIEMQQNVKLLGFTAYDPGHGYYIVDSKVAKI